MALNSCFYHSLCINSLINPADNKLTNNLLETLTKSSGLPVSPFYAVFYALTLTPIFISTLAFALTVGKHNNENL